VTLDGSGDPDDIDARLRDADRSRDRNSEQEST
jgi:hypothetical protein